MKKYFILALGILLATSTLQAAVITNTHSVAMGNLETATVSLGKFDTSLGTLTGVYIEFTTALYDIDYEFDNDTTRTKTVTVTLSSDTTGYFSSQARLTGTGISADGSDLFITAFGSLTLQSNDGDATGQFDVGGTDYGQWNPEIQSSTTGGSVDSSVFSDYTGTGNFTASVESEILAAIGTFTGVESGPNNLPLGTFSAKVVYDYVAVPEPATIGLLCIGCVLTLTTSRIRRNRAA